MKAKIKKNKRQQNKNVRSAKPRKRNGTKLVIDNLHASTIEGKKILPDQRHVERSS